MQGETLLWMRLADRQNWSLEEAQRKISSEEFILWKVYFDWDVNAFHRDDYFWAQIAYEIRCVLSKNPKRHKPEQFLIKFEEAKKKQESVETRTTRSKLFWLSLVGVKGVPLEKRGFDE